MIYPWRGVQLAKLYRVAEQEAVNNYTFDACTYKQEPEYKINHRGP